MINRVEDARQRLLEGGYTCVVLAEGGEFCSRERGVKPLLELLDRGIPCEGAVAADKTVGAGAAHLYVLIGVARLWANVISSSALRILEDNRIDVTYGECVPYIINRKGDGVCPIETAVADAKSSQEAYGMILKTLEQLNKK